MSNFKISSKGLKLYAPMTDKYTQSSTSASDLSPSRFHSNVSGSPVFGPNGLEVVATERAEFSVGDIFVGMSNISILLRFTPYFAAGDPVNAGIFYSTLVSSRQYYAFYTGSTGVLSVRLGSSIIANISLSEYADYWIENKENTFVVAGIYGNTDIWLNGNLIRHSTSSWNPGGTGMTVYVPTSAFVGIVRDLMIFDRIITDEERLAFESGTHGMYTPIKRTSLEKGLVLDVPLTDKWTQSSTVASDKTAYRNHGTANGGYSFTTDGLQIDGVDGDVVCTDHDVFSFTEGGGVDKPFSISIWANLTDATSSVLVAKGTYNIDMEYELDIDNNDYLRFFLTPSTASTFLGRSYNVAYPYQNEWVNIVGTYDGSKTQVGIKLYINSQRVDDTNIGAGSYTGMSNLGGSLFIGGGNGWQSTGTLYNAKMWNRELSEAEVSELYNKGRHGAQCKVISLSKGLIAHYPLTDKWLQSATVPSDISTTRFLFENVYGSDPSFSSEGMRLDGNHLYQPWDVKIDPSVYLGTISAWIKRDAATGVYIFTTGDSDAGHSSLNHFRFYVDTVGRLRINFFHSAHISDYVYTDVGAVPENEWCHVVGQTLGHNVGFKFYVNGEYVSILVAAYDTDGAGHWYHNFPSVDIVSIGGLYYNDIIYSTTYATINDLRIYERVLTDAEIMQLYKRGRE